MSDKALTVQTGLDLRSLGEVLASSGFFADTRDAAQAIVKVLAGHELGFGPVASMTGVNIIKGKVALSANLMGAAVKRSGRYNYRVVTLTDAECAIEFYESGKIIGRSAFTIQDAQRAGLTGGDNWRKFPRNMLFARALSNGVKWYCPDVTGGPAYTPDELGALVDEDGEVIETEIVTPPAPVHQPVADQSRRIQTNDPPAPVPDNGHEVRVAVLKPSEVDTLIEYARELRPDLKDVARAHISNSCLKALGIRQWTDGFSGGLERAKELVQKRALEKRAEPEAEAESPTEKPKRAKKSTQQTLPEAEAAPISGVCVDCGEITVRRAADGTWRCYECAIERDALAEIAEQEADA